MTNQYKVESVGLTEIRFHAWHYLWHSFFGHTELIRVHIPTRRDFSVCVDCGKSIYDD